MNGFLQLILSAVALLCTAYFVPGFKVAGFGNALLAALIIGVVNFFVRPVLLLLTLPLNILTLGLFTFVVNAMVLKLSAAFLPGFDIDGFGAAVLGAVILAIMASILQAVTALPA